MEEVGDCSEREEAEDCGKQEEADGRGKKAGEADDRGKQKVEAEALLRQTCGLHTHTSFLLGRY